MKLKGVNPIAQHIEKAVLGLTALVFLAVISMQFVVEPNKVSTGNREVSPDQIYNDLASTANALQSQISDLSPGLPEVQPVDLLSRYNNAFTTDNQSVTELASALGTGFDAAKQLGIGDFTPTGDKLQGDIEALTVPATSTPLASSTWGTLDPYAILEVPEYADFVPAAQPFDFPTVSIEADFSGTTLNNILEGNDGYSGVPRLFWKSTGMAIMGLEVQRQERQADGSWSNSQTITPPPGTPLPTNAVTKDDGLVRLNNIIASAQEVADEVMRPMYPPTISGPAWLPPSELLDSSDLGLTETQQLQRRLTRLNSQIDGLRNPASTRQTTTRDPAGGGGGKTTSRDPGSDPNIGSPRSSSSRNRDKIEKLEEQIEAIKEDLERLGVDAQDALTDSATDILSQEFIQLWAHDMGVEPGATYRYRTRAVLNNPYFRKGPYLDETDDAQQALTVEPFASGDWSDWSDPVDVGAKEFFFVTEATQPITGADLPKAKVELYSMYYGYYRRSSMTIEPGQSLLANLRVSGDLVIMDTAEIDAEDTAKYIQDQIDGTNTDSQLPDGITDAPDRLSINLGAHLLQIASDPVFAAQNPGNASSNLIFRLLDGSLEHRDSASAKASQLYAQAQSSSAKASRSQLRPTGQPAKSEAAELFMTAEP